MRRPWRIVVPLACAAVVALAVAVFLVVKAPIEQKMGVVQKIFYFHVPAAMLMYLGVAICLFASVGYLVTRRERFDEWAVAAAELVTLFTTIVLVTGPLWGRKSWGVFWIWEPRLTSTLIMWLTFVAYHALRRFAQNGVAGRRIAAGLGILAAIDAPIIHFSVKLWGGQHPIVMEGGGIQSTMAAGLVATLVFEVLLFGALFFSRVGLERARNRLRRVELAVALGSR